MTDRTTMADQARKIEAPMVIDRSRMMAPASVDLLIEEANVRNLVNGILTVLEKHYPAYSGNWHITVDTNPKGGMIYIVNMLISGLYGISLPISRVENDPGFKYIVMYAGELLERYRLKRSKNVDIEDEIKNLKHSPIGEAIADT